MNRRAQVRRDTERRSLRLFVACDLPPAVAGAVAVWQRRELARRKEVRVTPAVHLTLAFLGEVETARIGDVQSVLARIEWHRADCRFGEPLFLPAHGRRTAVALGVDDTLGRLRLLQSEVAGGLAAEGLYEPQDRPWLAHVTVARFRRPGHPFSLQNVNVGMFGVVRMVLYSSHLERAGAVHSPLADYPAS